MKPFVIAILTVLATGTFSHAQVNLEDGLLMYYPFSGNTNDLSPNGYHAVNNGAVLCPDRFGNPDAAYYFNGSANMEVPNTASLNLLSGFTLVGWFKTSPSHPSQSVISKHQNYIPCAYNMSISSENKVCLAIATNGNFWPYYSLAPVSYDEWHLGAVTYNAASFTSDIYIDGLFNTDFPTLLTTGSDVNYHIGSDDVLSFFTGYIDDVRVYDRPLNAEEMAALYTLSTGIDHKYNSNYSLYPNPAKDHLFINDLNGDEQIMVVDSKGSRINGWVKNGNQMEISELPAGLYSLIVLDNGVVCAIKFVKM